MRHAATLLAAALLAVAAAFGASALDPGRAQAADTVNVRTCTGGKMALKVDEKRMLDLHNQKRRSQERFGGSACIPRSRGRPATTRRT